MALPETFTDIETCVDAVIAAAGREIVLGIPLGLGKPNGFVNALYRRVAAEPSLQLRIVTALTPAVPKGRSLLERRFLAPLVGRIWAGYEPLDYAAAVASGSLPPNIDVEEFYFAPGSALGAPYAQRHHVNANYSQVARLLADRGVNVIAQAVARHGEGAAARYSFGSNADLTRDVVAALGADRRPFLVGVVTPAMPFMPHDAATEPGFWNAIVDTAGDAGPSSAAAGPAGEPLFVVPNEPVGLVDYAIATHVASLVEDGGTLQIGIGSLGDAVAHVIRLRQTDNAAYRALCERLVGEPELALRAALPVRLEPFAEGLYAASEMLVEGLLHLIEAGVVRRRVDTVAADGAKVLLHAAFFIGSAELYRRLSSLDDDTRAAIEMTGVGFVNTLDGDYARKCRDRRDARFVNSAMMVTLDGAVVSDALEGKRVVSGVGGQHDFVGMAQHLPGARSIIVLPATRTKAGRAQSNIVFEYAHTTVPRQFRDIVVTEYGAADLRGASDRDVMVRLLGIADARFQSALLERAQAAGKIERGFALPDAYRANTPARLEARLEGAVLAKLPHFPLSSEFDDTEARLAVALEWLGARAGSKLALARLALGGPGPRGENVASLLSRMGLERPRGFEERVSRRLLLAALAATDDERPLR